MIFHIKTTQPFSGLLFDMKIVYIHKAEFHKRPPVISAVLILAELGYEVILITCGISPELHKRLAEMGIVINVIPQNENHNHNKIIGYIRFRQKVKKIINNIKKANEKNILWIEGAYTIVSLFGVIHKFPYILQIQELHEDSRIQKFAISRTIHNAKVVFMPEYNRTVIFQIWFGLKTRPVVLPNKPYFLPRESELQELKNKYKNQLTQFVGKKVILYQGGISSERMLENLAEALKTLNNEFVLLLVGKEHEKGYIDKLKKIYNSVIHIPFLPAPDYLVFSTIAYIGYVCYAPTSLNNAYCAPNKINEYSAYSLPMIGNDIPGLKSIFELNNSGIIIDDNSIESIVNGIVQIDSNYAFYKENASNIFKKIDNKEIIASSLRNITK